MSDDYKRGQDVEGEAWGEWGRTGSGWPLGPARAGLGLAHTNKNRVSGLPKIGGVAGLGQALVSNVCEILKDVGCAGVIIITIIINVYI